MKSTSARQRSVPSAVPKPKRATLQRDQPGYYPGYSTLRQQGYWDEATRKTVLHRVNNVPPICFFQSEEVRFWETVFDHLMPQSDRMGERRIPIVNHVDHKLEINQSQGYRFENMPPDREAYRLGMLAIDQEAHARFRRGFIPCFYPEQEEVLKAIHDGEPISAGEIWEKMSVHRFWQLIMGDAIDAYYAHPWAWDEIGFGGPAYPRAYTRLERGEPEPWEAEEQRYEWESPAGTSSDEIEDMREHFIESVQHMSHVKRVRAK